MVTQTFPARPSSIPEIRDFVLRHARRPADPEGSQQLHHAVLNAPDAASPTAARSRSVRFPDGVEVDVRGPASAGSTFPPVRRDRPEHRSFASGCRGC